MTSKVKFVVLVAAIALAVIALVLMLPTRRSTKANVTNPGFVPDSSLLPELPVTAVTGKRVVFPFLPTAKDAKVAAAMMNEKYRNGLSHGFSAIMPATSAMDADGVINGPLGTCLFVSNFYTVDNLHRSSVHGMLQKRAQAWKSLPGSFALRGPDFYGVILCLPGDVLKPDVSKFDFCFVNGSDLILEGFVFWPTKSRGAKDEALSTLRYIVDSIKVEPVGPGSPKPWAPR